jgi:hypothetical protein
LACFIEKLKKSVKVRMMKPICLEEALVDARCCILAAVEVVKDMFVLWVL